MKTTTRDDIYNIILNYYPVSAKYLKEKLWISNEMIHRHLKKLIDENKIYKTGSSPKVHYFPNLDTQISHISFNHSQSKILEENFLNISPDWVFTYWVDWFVKWCQKKELDPYKEIDIYIETIEKYWKYKNNWFINWQDKLKSTFDTIYLDEIYYLDFYSIEKYWKTLLWNLMFYAKQSGDKLLINKIIWMIKPYITNLLIEKNIDSYSFIPPSIKRNIQIQTEINKWLKIQLPEQILLKIFKDKIVSQKSLNKKEDRIINARNTIFVSENRIQSNKILLIDDDIWSWATLNETAKKIKESWIAKYVIWLAIVWSFKWFDVISEL